MLRASVCRVGVRVLSQPALISGLVAGSVRQFSSSGGPNSDWGKIANKLIEEGKRERSSRLQVDDGGYNAVDVNDWPPSKVNTILNVCKRGHVAVIERFGKMSRIEDAGLFLALPVIDQIAYVVDTRELTLVVDPQNCVTRDNVDVTVGGCIFVSVVDPEKACYSVRRPLYALKQEALSAMRTAIGKVTLDELFHDRLALNRSVCQAMMHTKDDWGLVVERYELREINPDASVKSAMDRQSVAERVRRETILTAKADREAMETRSEGQRISDINVAQGQREAVELKAAADAARVKLEADAKAYAIKQVSEALESKGGAKAMEYNLAVNYLDNLLQVLPNSQMNTVYLPNDLGDLPKMMATAKGILGDESNLLAAAKNTVLKQ